MRITHPAILGGAVALLHQPLTALIYAFINVVFGRSLPRFFWGLAHEYLLWTYRAPLRGWSLGVKVSNVAALVLLVAAAATVYYGVRM